MSSSGLVRPSGLPIRDLKVTGSLSRAPLIPDTLPLPCTRSPSQTVLASRLTMVMALMLSLLSYGQPIAGLQGYTTTLGHMPLVVKEAYALNSGGQLESTIVPGRVEEDQESPCSA